MPAYKQIRAGGKGGYDSLAYGDRPVSRWRLNEVNSTAANDLLGVNSGSFSGDYTLGVAGPLARASNGGGATQFGGTNAVATITYSSSLKFGTGDFSALAWVKTTQSNPTSHESVIIGVNRYFVGEGWLLELGDSNSGNWGKPSFSTFGTGGANYTVGSAAVNDGIWHLLAAVRTSTAVFLYVDGAQAATASVTGAYNSNGGGANIYFGALGDTTTGIKAGYYFNGSISGVEVLGSALTAAQLKARYLAGVNGF